MLRRSGLEQLLGCMRVCLIVSASGASRQIYRLRKARAQAKSGASEGNRDAKRQRWKAGGFAGLVRRANSVKKRLPLSFGISQANIEAKTSSRNTLASIYTRGY